MKYSIITFAWVAVASASFLACSQAQSTQPSEVPSVVLTAFQEKFPQASDIAWDKESDTEWEAEFKMDNKEMSANFSPEGKWLQTETDIKEKELPEAVKNTIKSQFIGYEIEESAQVAMPEQNEAYEVELEKGKATLEVVIDSSGKVLRQAITEDDDGQ